MKNKLIALCFIMSFLSISFCFFDTVKAAFITYTQGFEEQILGDDFSILLDTNGAIQSKQMSATFKISNTEKHSGSLSFKATNGAIGYWNLTYSVVSYLTNFTFWQFIQSDADTDNYIYFYNKTLGVSNPLIKMRFFISGGVYRFYWYENGIVDAGTTITFTSNQFNRVFFNIDSDTGTATYGMGSTVSTGNFANNCSAINLNYRIDRIYFTVLAAAQYSYYDDLIYKISDSYTVGGSSSCGISLGDYDKLGIDNTPNTMDLNYPVFQKINYGLNYGYLSYVTLCVNPSMYSIDSNSNNYTLECIGFDLGGADCFDLDGYNYRLIWEAGIDLGDRVEGIPSGRNIDCFFTHASKVGSVAYWQVCVGSTADTDLDSDGKTSFKLWNDARTVIDYDVGVSFYFDATTRYEPSDSIFSDSLGLQNYISKNSTGYIYDINQPEGIVCSYLLSESSRTYESKIVVMKNTSTYEVNYTGLTFPSGVRGFLPTTIGKYTFKLYNYHYVYNITAYVTGSPSSYFISSSPTITNPFESYNIVYRYYNIIGHDGNIGIFSDYSERGSFVYSDTSYIVDVNTTGTKNYPSTSLTNEYLTLFVNASVNQPVSYATHWIRDNNILENNLYVSPAELSIHKGNPDGYSVEIIGSHVFVGSKISIFIQGEEMFSVRDDQSFNRTFAPPQPDSYNVSLRLYQNGSWITLKYCYITVSDLGAEGGEDTFSFEIEPPYSYFAGIFIIIISTLSPLLIIGMVKHDFNLSSIPQFLYLVMAVIGFVITIILGFFPLWSVAVLVLLSALIIAIIWLKGGTTV